MMRMYVIGTSRDGRGAIVRWAQKVENSEQAEKVAAEWEAAGIADIQIVEL